MNSAAFQRRNEVVLGRVNVYTMHGSRQERLYLNKKPQTGMKWFFMRRQNPKFDAFVQRSTGGPAISTQCSCSSESIFYAIKNWEFGGSTPTHIFISAFEIHFKFSVSSWDYPDLTNNEVVRDFTSFHPIQTLSSSKLCHQHCTQLFHIHPSVPNDFNWEIAGW